MAATEKRLTLKDYARVARPGAADMFEDDLLYDLRYDRTLPDVTSYRALRRYLVFHNACEPALSAAPGVWRRYRGWRDRHKKARSAGVKDQLHRPGVDGERGNAVDNREPE
jgi:hypothetical protein